MAKKKSKKYLEAAKQVEAGKAYDASEALALVKKIDFANFDATIEVAFNLNLDTKQADQQLRGALVLPNGTGKEQTVVVFAKGPKAQEAKDAGADVVGDDDLVQRIQDGWLDFDVAIATPDMMAATTIAGSIPMDTARGTKIGTVITISTQKLAAAKATAATTRKVIIGRS